MSSSEYTRCPFCENEWRLVESSANRLSPMYCPYCGTGLDADDDDLEFADDDHERFDEDEEF